MLLGSVSGSTGAPFSVVFTRRRAGSPGKTIVQTVCKIRAAQKDLHNWFASTESTPILTSLKGTRHLIKISRLPRSLGRAGRPHAKHRHHLLAPPRVDPLTRFHAPHADHLLFFISPACHSTSALNPYTLNVGSNKRWDAELTYQVRYLGMLK